MNLDNFKVTDRKSFIEFLEHLREDLNTNRNQWENKTLEDFLEAMARYSNDIQGYYDNRKSEIGEKINADIPTWKVFSDVMKGSRVYE